MEKQFNVSDIITPKFSFADYVEGEVYQVVNKKSDRFFYKVYNVYCIKTGNITNYPCLFANTRFKRI